MRGGCVDIDLYYYSVDVLLSLLAGLADAAGLWRVGGGAKAWPGSVDVICGVD
jgi:hypothetical protein